MRKFFKTAGLIVLAALVLVVLLTLVGKFSKGTNPTTRAFQTAAAPVEKLLKKGTDAFGRLLAYTRGYDELLAENEALKSQIAQMEGEVRRSQAANLENERLRTALGLKQSHTDYDLLDAKLISWNSSNYASSFDLDKGTFEGVENGDCVITADGYVVGVVTEAGLYSCSVRTLIDSQAAMGAMLQSTGLSAVAEGDFSLMTSGQLRLTYVFEGAALEIGDTVLTSGAGGVYPAGLVIGKITDVGYDDSGYGQYGVIAPSAELYSLTQVFIIRDYGENADAE